MTPHKPTLEQLRKIARKGQVEAARVILDDPQRYEKYGEARVRLAERELAAAGCLVAKAGVR